MAYTTALKVRKILPGMLIGDDDIGTVTSGSTITLNNPAIDVASVLKNSTELAVTTGFTFTRPRTVTLVAEASGENFIVTSYYGASDGDLEAIVARADRRIDAYFGQMSTPSSEYLDDWSATLAASMWLRSFATANDENIARATELETMVVDDMKRYKEENEPEQAARTNYSYVVTTQ